MGLKPFVINSTMLVLYISEFFFDTKIQIHFFYLIDIHFKFPMHKLNRLFPIEKLVLTLVLEIYENITESVDLVWRFTLIYISD